MNDERVVVFTFFPEFGMREEKGKKREESTEERKKIASLR